MGFICVPLPMVMSSFIICSNHTKHQKDMEKPG